MGWLVILSICRSFFSGHHIHGTGQSQASIIRSIVEKRIFGKQGPSQLSSFVMSEDVARALLDPSHFHYILITPARKHWRISAKIRKAFTHKYNPSYRPFLQSIEEGRGQCECRSSQEVIRMGRLR